MDMSALQRSLSPIALSFVLLASACSRPGDPTVSTEGSTTASAAGEAWWDESGIAGIKWGAGVGDAQAMAAVTLGSPIGTSDDRCRPGTTSVSYRDLTLRFDRKGLYGFVLRRDMKTTTGIHLGTTLADLRSLDPHVLIAKTTSGEYGWKSIRRDDVRIEGLLTSNIDDARVVGAVFVSAHDPQETCGT